MKHIFTILLVSFCSLSLFANTKGSISGIISDQKTKKAIPGVAVYIPQLNTGTATDENGRYQLQIPYGTYEIKFSSVGYAALKRTVKVTKSNANYNVSLVEKTQEIQGVEVTAQTEISKKRKGPEPITIIDAKEIRGRATSLEHVLSKAAGVKIRKSGGLGSASRIQIHGLEGKRIQLFIDGDAVNSPDGNFTIDEIPIDLIERIEVYKGIVPARFGGDGIGGAINVVIRKFEDDYVDLSYQRGSYNTNRVSWVLKKNLIKPGIEFGTGGFFNYADNDYTFKSPYQNGVTIKRDHDKFQSYTIGTGLIFTKLWFDEIEIGGDFYFNHKEIQGIKENYQHAETRANAILPGLSLEKENFFMNGLSFENNLSLVLMNYNFIDTSHVHYYLDGSINTEKTKQGEIGYYPRNSDDKQTEIRNRLNLHYQISDKHAINLNHSFRHSKYKPKDPLASTHAGFDVTNYPSSLTSSITGLTYELKLFDDRLISMTGIKLFKFKSDVAVSDVVFGSTTDGLLDKNATSFSKTAYSEALRYKISPWLNLKASYQHAIRLPNTVELFGNGDLIESNPYLSYEESDNFNFGVFIDTYSFLFFHRLQFETNLFSYNVENYIRKSRGITGFQYQNLRNVKIKGVDVELKIDATKHIFLHGNFTYQDSRDASKTRVDGTSNPTYDMRTPNLPWCFSNFGAEYHKEDLFLKDTFFKCFWTSSYTHEFFYNWEMSKLNSRRIPTSFTHDAGIECAFKNNKYIISIEVQNLTDEEVSNNYRMPLMGRAFYAKLRYTFMRSAK